MCTPTNDMFVFYRNSSKTLPISSIKLPLQPESPMIKGLIYVG
jgi:hypothetical protein